VFRYLFAYTIAPLVRRVTAVVLVAGMLAFAVTVPARLWVLYVSPRPSETTVVTLNIATFALIVWMLLSIFFHRRRKTKR
jgi:hypothetical protein